MRIEVVRIKVVMEQGAMGKTRTQVERFMVVNAAKFRLVADLTFVVDVLLIMTWLQRAHQPTPLPKQTLVAFPATKTITISTNHSHRGRQPGEPKTISTPAKAISVGLFVYRYCPTNCPAFLQSKSCYTLSSSIHSTPQEAHYPLTRSYCQTDPLHSYSPSCTIWHSPSSTPPPRHAMPPPVLPTS